MTEARRRRFSLTRHSSTLWAIPAFGLLLIGAVWVGTWMQFSTAERMLLDAAVRDTNVLAVGFEQFTRRTIRDVDRLALLLKHEFENHQSVDLAELVEDGLIEGTGATTIGILNANGDVVVHSKGAPTFNVADREWFQTHTTWDTRRLEISKPIVSRASGRPATLLSRRLNHREGSFAGVVSVSVPPEYFTQYFAASELGRHVGLGLLGMDGEFRARRNGVETAAPSDSSADDLLARAEANPAGHFEVSGSDGSITSIVAYRKLTDYPFMVTVTRSTSEALAGLYASRHRYVLFAIACTCAIVLFFAVVTILARRLQRHRYELKTQRAFLKKLVDNLPSSITVRSFRPENRGQYILCNESTEIIFGIRPEDALGKTVRERMSPRYAAMIEELDRTMLESPMVQDVVQERETPTGRRYVHLIRAPIFAADNSTVDCIMTSASDITVERVRNEELRLASKVFETTADAIMLSDADDRVVRVNAAFTRMTGYSEGEIVGQILAESPFRPLDPVVANLRMEQLRREGHITDEVSRRRKNGTPLALWLTASVVRNEAGKVTNYTRVFTDISQLKEAQRKLERLASCDALTGLPNRRLLTDRLEQAVRRAKRTGEGLATMFVDLDGFKQVNDTYGHDVGDLLLKAVALRLQACVRVNDTVGRIGGDEFAILLEDSTLPEDAARVGERIVSALATPFDLDNAQVSIAGSIGIAIYPHDGSEAATLLKNADVAMYEAKQAGRNRFVFLSQERAALS